MKLMKIGEMARLNAVSVQTLRYYDEIGLLKPYHVDEENGYRYYHLSQSARLDLIQFLKSLDFTLEEVYLLLENAENHELLDYVLLKKASDLDRQLFELKLKREQITSFHEAYDCYIENIDEQAIRIERFPERYIYTYPIDQNIYEMDLLQYEHYLREFKMHLQAELPSYIHYFSRVGSLVRKDNFKKKNFVSDILFVFLNKRPIIDGYETLQEGQYAVSFCDCFDLELKHIHRLYRFLEQNNYEITGDYVCEVVYEIPKKNPSQRSMFIRLQVPVRKVYV